MDPNANLEEQRNIAKRMEEGEADSRDALRLGELVQALDEWLYNYGFLPTDWDRTYRLVRTPKTRGLLLKLNTAIHEAEIAGSILRELLLEVIDKPMKKLEIGDHVFVKPNPLGTVRGAHTVIECSRDGREFLVVAGHLDNVRDAPSGDRAWFDECRISKTAE